MSKKAHRISGAAAYKAVWLCLTCAAHYARSLVRAVVSLSHYNGFLYIVNGQMKNYARKMNNYTFWQCALIGGDEEMKEKRSQDQF